MTRAFKVDISAPSIIKDGGTSSQFLKADGSVDTATYLSTGTAASTYLSISTASTTYAPLTSPQLLTPFIKRVDSTNEGGQIDFARALDNTQAWYLDVYGNTSTPSFRIVDVSNAAVRLQIDGATGNVSAQGFVKNGGTSSQYLMADGSVSTGTSGPLTQTALSTGFSIAGGTTSKTLQINNTLTFAGTDSTTMTFPATSGTVATLNTANTFTSDQTITPATAVTAVSINGATSSTGLIIKAAATPGTFIDYRDNGNTSVGGVGSDGTHFIKNIRNVGGSVNRAVFSDLTASLIVNAANTNYVGLSVRRFNDSQTSDLQQWTNSNASTVYAKIDKDGNATAASFIASTGALTTSSTELTLQQTGDTFGTSTLRIQNRNGQNGPLIDNSLSTVNLLDLGFKSASSQGNIRYEARALSGNNTATNGPEFQIGNTGIISQYNPQFVSFPLIIGTGLSDRRVQVNSTTGNTVALTVRGHITLTATITGATVNTFANKTGTVVTTGAVTKITGITSTTGLLPGMILTYVSGAGTFGGGTGTVISVDSATALSIYTTGNAVAGSITFSIQNSVTYTATNTFSQTQNVTITGISTPTLNVSNAFIGAVSGSTFTIINTDASGTWSSGGTATVEQVASLQEWQNSSYGMLAKVDKNGNFTANSFIKSGGTSSQYLMADGSTSSTTQLDITPLDDISNQFDGSTYRFVPKYQGQTITISNQFRLLLTINGIIQRVRSADYVWQSPIPINGIRVDNDGYIVFPEAVPAGSEFDARLMAGPTTTSSTTLYPFRAVDILLGG